MLFAGLLPSLVASEIETALSEAGQNAGEISTFLEEARELHGDFGENAAAFLVKGMPERDLETLKTDFLMENLNLALKAREQFPWAKALPEEVFFNDVLPYASLDETREPWRKAFYPECTNLVKDCETAAEAAQALNKNFFNLLEVHYNTGRKAPNQSPFESKELGKATCTGLGIILVDACRTVGVPARVAGIFSWPNKRGNHSWVEIYDGEEWHFTGADEYNADGLDRAWFVESASKAIAEDWRHAVWATSWKKTDAHFPMVWNRDDKSVPAVNVTARYVKNNGTAPAEATIFLRLWEKQGGKRIAAPVDLVDSDGSVLQTVTTKAGTADRNDMPSISVRPGLDHRLRVTRDGESRWKHLNARPPGDETVDLFWPELGTGSVSLEEVKDWVTLSPEERRLSVPQGTLSRQDADEAIALVWDMVRKEVKESRQRELADKVVKAADFEMKYLEAEFGTAKEGERSLWISMHGGGGAPARVNEQQWQNQIRLYSPEEGIVVAPRAPTDSWNMWHQDHIDDLFGRLIDNFVTARGVSPDRVYLMGYSAGGDGVYQLAPRMADRFAAASMMAGHPNDADPLGLRNLPFMIFMGGEDKAYSRNRVAAEWGERLAELQKHDSGGYEHKVTIYEGLGHWMNGKDREALPWMAERRRNPWPKKIVWRQAGRTHNRFYWLEMPEGVAESGQTVRAEINGQTIDVKRENVAALNLRLNDALLDLDQPVIVRVNMEEKFRGKVGRTVEAIWKSLRERPDPASAATGLLELKF